MNDTLFTKAIELYGEKKMDITDDVVSKFFNLTDDESVELKLKASDPKETYENLLGLIKWCEDYSIIFELREEK